jgi:protein-S-isoprenylcysteine O-methyltransferase Ste14
MSNATDSANVVIRPPIAWVLAIVAGLAADRVHPLRFVPAFVPGGWIGGAVFVLGFLLAVWAIATMRRAGTRIETSQPTSAIVTGGPYRFVRNPIYIGMLCGQVGLAVGLDNLWLLVMLVPFYLVIRYGVVAREEAYLERKFGDVYLGYKTRVRRWL